ncbi:hypothetical protein [Nocardia sp. NPDC004604]|uniref:hypothetical protein n=1 Tax=Nocardia sp. NPDC004604 TaxID=3157013 RepID=UPI0033A6EEBB
MDIGSATVPRCRDPETEVATKPQQLIAMLGQGALEFVVCRMGRSFRRAWSGR